MSSIILSVLQILFYLILKKKALYDIDIPIMHNLQPGN